jgi:hypothetical protein
MASIGDQSLYAAPITKLLEQAVRAYRIARGQDAE